MKLQIRHGGLLDGPVVTTEDGKMLPGQKRVIVDYRVKDVPTVTVELIIDGTQVSFRLQEKAVSR
jgi:hypothetical protein